MCRWESDQLIVLGDWESQLHGEAADSLGLIQQDTCALFNEGLGPLFNERNNPSMRTDSELITCGSEMILKFGS